MTTHPSNDVHFAPDSTHENPSPDREHEVELFRRYREHDDRRAVDELVKGNQRHVVSLARKYSGYGVPVNELIAEGNVGVALALVRFDVSRGVRFGTYAAHWVRAQMLACVIQSRTSVGGSDGPMRSQMFFKLRRESARVFSEMGAGVQADSELARRLGVSIERLAKLRQRLESTSVPLDSPGLLGGHAPIERLSSSSDQEQELHERRTGELARLAITAAVQRLDQREQLIVRAHVMADGDEETSLAALARQLGISRERVRQLETRALKKLRKLLTAEPKLALAEREVRAANRVERPAVVRRRRRSQRNQATLAA